MQYPIIDNLIYAYIRNGWTGLDFNPINIWDEQWEVGGISPSTGLDNPSDNSIRSLFIPCNENTSYYLHTNVSASYVWFYDSEYNFISFSTETVNRVFTTPANCYFIRLRIGDSSNVVQEYAGGISVNYPPTYTAYISSEESEDHIKTFKDDIAHRLRLPLIRNFPHPVIDALISAADRQHTEEEKEILRHYLTPLGIGGI